MELEGFEPSSKRGIDGLSTCVVSSWFSRSAWPETATRFLILYVFDRAPRKGLVYSRYSCTAGSARLGKRAAGRCLVAATFAAIKLIYCASIKQQERSCFRHLDWSVIRFLRAWIPKLCTLTHHFCTLSKPVSPVLLPQSRGGLAELQNYSFYSLQPNYKA